MGSQESLSYEINSILKESDDSFINLISEQSFLAHYNLLVSKQSSSNEIISLVLQYYLKFSKWLEVPFIRYKECNPTMFGVLVQLHPNFPMELLPDHIWAQFETDSLKNDHETLFDYIHDDCLTYSFFANHRLIMKLKADTLNQWKILFKSFKGHISFSILQKSNEFVPSIAVLYPLLQFSFSERFSHLLWLIRLDHFQSITFGSYWTVSFANSFNPKILKDFVDNKFEVSTKPFVSKKVKMVVFDMDSTLIDQECIDEMAKIVGVEDKVKEITESAMQGKLDFEESLNTRVRLLSGSTAIELYDTVKKLITFKPGVRNLCEKLSKENVILLVVSGGFLPLAQYVQSELHLNYSFANCLEEENGILTGRVIDPVVDGIRKKYILETIAQLHQIPIDQVAAIGDGSNDIPMMLSCGVGIAFNAKQSVQEKVGAQ